MNAREGPGQIVVCGEVNGRNSAGAYPGMAPFVGVMMGTRAPEFIVISIAQNGPPRAEIEAICQQSGIRLMENIPSAIHEREDCS